MNRQFLPIGLAAVLAGALVGLTAESGPAARATAEISKRPPLIGGFAFGKPVTYLLTDVSQRQDARDLSKATKYPVAYVARLNRVPESALARLYLFTNGVKGPNPFGFQANVLDSLPGQAKYSPLWRVYAVTWKAGASARVLKSEQAVLAAQSKGELTLKKTGLIKNSPVVP